MVDVPYKGTGSVRIVATMTIEYEHKDSWGSGETIKSLHERAVKEMQASLTFSGGDFQPGPGRRLRIISVDKVRSVSSEESR